MKHLINQLLIKKPDFAIQSCHKKTKIYINLNRHLKNQKLIETCILLIQLNVYDLIY